MQKMTYEELCALIQKALYEMPEGADRVTTIVNLLDRHGFLYRIDDEYQQFPVNQKRKTKLPVRCKEPKCTKRARTHGYCQTHYLKARRAGLIGEISKCYIDDCNNPIEAKGLCFTHYRKAFR